jgi:hypothetical protein
MKKIIPKSSIIDKLEEALYRTGYVKYGSIEIFPGKFNSDPRLDENPYVRYVLVLENEKRDTGLHKLEEEIGNGFLPDQYPEAYITICTTRLSKNEEEHKINVEFRENKSDEDRYKRVARMATHLRKIIEDYHFKC